jgi:polysaccharide export outer membrane protein
VDSLKGKAIEPQAVVTITTNISNTATVTGEVTEGKRVPLSVNGDRILSVIASAGGIRAAANECFIRLTRNGHTVSVAFNKILADPRENIFIRPGDVVTVIREPQTFTAFGGTGKNASVPFDATGITLEEAIAKAGGLLDYRADPSGVFLLRFEPAPLVTELTNSEQNHFTRELVPVVYRLNLRDATSYFLARTIPMHNRDILYVANAPLNEIQKMLTAIGQLTQPVVSGAAIYSTTK